MLVISELNYFGSYPNKFESDFHLCFQHQYTCEGSTTKKRTLIPDIVSLQLSENKDDYSREHPLVIELKQDGNIASSKTSTVKDLHKRIKKIGSCLESDILKTRIYLTKDKDSDTFEIGVVLNLVTECSMEDFNWLEKMLIRQQKEFLKVNSNDSHKNLLFAWYNPISDSPEFFWLDRPEPIFLSRKKETSLCNLSSENSKKRSVFNGNSKKINQPSLFDLSKI